MLSALGKMSENLFKTSPDVPKITLGVCAMDKKANSKPMRQILNRLNPALYDIIIFGDDRIVNEPIETWPVVECLITFYSSNFPIERALKYIELRNPFLINDLKMNSVLVDRTQIYDMLESLDINVPQHVYCDRTPDVDGNIPNREVEEYDDYIVIDGKKVHKPFVEKPYNAEDHNIYIYCK